LILLIVFGIWLQKKNRIVVIVATILVLGLSLYKQSIVFSHWSQGGLGYASYQWYDSEAMAFLRDVPEDVMIYTNEPGAVYLYTGRGAYVLPSRYDTATAQERQGFETAVADMQADIFKGAAVMAIFDEGSNIPKDVESLTDGLYLAFKAQGDSIYTEER
jgi:hypothetical protein